MKTPPYRYESIDVASEYDSVLINRDSGAEIVARIGDLEQGSFLLANFEGVERVGVGFLKAAFEGVDSHIRRFREEASLVALTNTSPQVEAEIMHVLSGENSPLAGIASAHEGSFKLITPYLAIEDTFDAAKLQSAEHGSFSAAALAEKLEVDYRNILGRLKVLHKTGAITCWESDRVKFGPYRYRTVIDADLVAERA